MAFNEWFGFGCAVLYGASVWHTHGPKTWWTPVVVAFTCALWILHARYYRRKSAP